MSAALSSAALAVRSGPAVSQSAGSSRPPLPSKPTLPRLAAPTPPAPKAPVPPAPPPKPQVPADVAAAKQEVDQSPALSQSQARPPGAGPPPGARLVLKNGVKPRDSRPPPPRGGDVPPLRVAARIRTADSNAASVQSLDQILDRVEKGFQNELNDRQQPAGTSSSSSSRDSRPRPAGLWRSKVDEPKSSAGASLFVAPKEPRVGSGSSVYIPSKEARVSPAGSASVAPREPRLGSAPSVPPAPRETRVSPAAGVAAVPKESRVKPAASVSAAPEELKVSPAAPVSVSPIDPSASSSASASVTLSTPILSLNGVQTGQPSKPDARKPSLVRPAPPRRPTAAILQKPSPPVKPKPAGPIFKDVGASPQVGRPNGAQAPVKPNGGSPQAAVAPGGPILKDVGAGPKSKAVDPVLATAAVAVPPKFTKAAPVKGKEDWRKKSTSAPVEGAAAKRRVGVREKGTGVEDAGAAELDIPGVAARRGTGRKSSKASRKAARNEAARAAAPVKVDILEVGKQGLSVEELAANLAVNEGEIVKTLFLKGISTTVTQILDEETVRLVCKEYDVEVIEAGVLEVKDMAKKNMEFMDEDDLKFLEVRPPVVTVMGHVDHGKTSLLDYIRRAKVAASEAGGITQGIGAYRVPVNYNGAQQTCVFIDTPGHEAFSAMRARGAKVTDIAIIVVAADDGVRPQSLEAIAHAKAAKVPMVFALNKIDKEGANPERVKQELANNGVLPEEWGGDTPMVEVSAITGENIDSLLETVMLVAELQDLKANPTRHARGTVIEASLDKSRGALATLLVQNGTLKQGDVVLSGESYGKVRALLDDSGSRVDDAGPSMAVQVIGLSRVPVAGDSFEVLTNLDDARERAEEQAELMRVARLAAQAGEGKVTLSSGAANQGPTIERHQLNVVLKVDAQGSVEPIREALLSLPQNTVSLRFLAQETGDITTSEIDLAVASEAVVVGFNVGLQPGVQLQADSEGVNVRIYKVIYDLVDDIRKIMEGLLAVVQEQVPLGRAEVRAVFGSGSSKVAGCIVTEGKLVKGCGLNVIRAKNVIHTGSLDSLRRVKESAKEVVAGLECGLGVDDFLEWKEGDVIEAFNLVEKRRTLEEAAETTAARVANNQSSWASGL